MRRDYRGKRVYVLGGSQGIGRACAEAFASRGAHVVVFARHEGPLREACQGIAGRCQDAGQGVTPVVLDVSDAAAVAEVMEATRVAHGPPDLLLNCVGGARPGYFEDLGTEQMLETWRVNWLSCWLPIRALVPHMKERGGVIVNTASLAGLIGVFGYTDYCAAKFAVVGFSEALRSELAPHGIEVFVLCPPDTDTPGFAAEEVGKPAETRAVSGAVALSSPEKVAEALLRGIERRSFLIVPGSAGRLAALAQRIAPSAVRWFADRAVRGARNSSAD